jgi:hypothetical protein
VWRHSSFEDEILAGPAMTRDETIPPTQKDEIKPRAMVAPIYETLGILVRLCVLPRWRPVWTLDAMLKPLSIKIARRRIRPN